MIIDAHTHIFEPGAREKPRRPAGAEDLLRRMDETGIDLSIVIPLPGNATNEHVHEACRRHPDRLQGLYTPPFLEPGWSLAAMERFFGEFAPRGIKIHPRLQGVTARDPAVREVVAWAAAKGVTVVLDAFPSGPALDAEGASPLAFHRLAQDFPDARIVLAHAGGYRVLDAFMAAKANPNVVLDLSFTIAYFEGSSVERDLRFACGHLYPGRVLYGSDFPHVDLGEYLDKARAFLGGLDEERREGIFHGAARRAFGLEPRTRPPAP